MEWTQFKPLDNKTAEEVIDKMITGFSEATGNLVDMQIVQKTGPELLASKLIAQFKYDLVLFSSLVRGYKFSFFEFGYDVTLYPCYIKMDDEIALQINKNNTILVHNETEVENIVKEIFASKRFLEVVSGLMKIAGNQDLPF